MSNLRPTVFLLSNLLDLYDDQVWGEFYERQFPRMAKVNKVFLLSPEYEEEFKKGDYLHEAVECDSSFDEAKPKISIFVSRV